MSSNSKLLFHEFFEVLKTENLVDDIELTQIPDFQEFKSQIFRCSFEGPFIFCYKLKDHQNEQGLSEKGEFINYFPIIFLPHFLFNQSNEDNSITFIPIFPDLYTSFKLKFQDKIQLKKWLSQAVTVRNTIEKMSKELPPFVLPIEVEESSINRYVSAIVSDKKLMYVDQNRTLREYDMDQISSINILSILLQSQIPNPFSALLSFRMDKNKKEYLHFQTKDDFILGFFVIFYGIYSCAKQNQNQSIELNFAQEIPRKEYELLSPLTLESKPFSANCSKQNSIFTFKPTISPNVNNIAAVAVPKKASDQLEILLFGLPMKRRVYVAMSDQSKSKTKKHRKREMAIHVSMNHFNQTRNFERELDKIINETSFKENQIISAKNPNQKSTFKILEQSLIGFFESQNSPLSFLMREEPKIPSDVKLLFDKLKFPTEHLQKEENMNNIEQREYLQIQIANIIESIKLELKAKQIDTISISKNKNCRKLVLLLSSLLFDLPKPTTDILHEIKQLVFNERSLSICFPTGSNVSRNNYASKPKNTESNQQRIVFEDDSSQEQNSNGDSNKNLEICCIFISRLLFEKKLYHFLKLLSNNTEWRLKFYMPGSLMLLTPLICDICEQLQQIEQINFSDCFVKKKFYTSLHMSLSTSAPLITGSSQNLLINQPQTVLEDDNICISKCNENDDIQLIPIETIENRIIMICNAILDNQRKGSTQYVGDETEDEYQAASFGLLIQFICDFFDIGFIPPENSVISCLRHSWYTFASSTELPNDANEFGALKATIRECSMNYATTPENLMRLLFFKGFVNGIAWAFVLFGGLRAQDTSLYKNDSPAASPEKVSSISLALSSLRTTLIDAEEKKVLKYSELFSSFPFL